jgi:arsenite transporter
VTVIERTLSFWVGLCIVAGIILGRLTPGVFHAIGALGQVRQHWRGIGVTLFINWAVKPFSMALLGSFFIGHVFRAYLPAGQIESYIAGLILLAAAPCTAMVFVVESRPGRAAFHAEPSGAQRCHHMLSVYNRVKIRLSA